MDKDGSNDDDSGDEYGELHDAYMDNKDDMVSFLVDILCPYHLLHRNCNPCRDILLYTPVIPSKIYTAYNMVYEEKVLQLFIDFNISEGI